MSYTSMLNDLRHKRGNAIDHASTILNAATSAKRDLTPEENTKFDAFHKEADELRSSIERIERQVSAEAQLNEPTEVRAGKTTGAPEVAGESPEYRKAFNTFIRSGMRTPDLESRAALSTADQTQGGYTVPQSLATEIDVALKAFGGMRASRAVIMKTASGEPMSLPTANDTNNVGSIIAENAVVTTVTPTFGTVSLRPYMYSSGIVPISLQLLQDAAYDMDSFIRDLITIRIGRAANAHYTNGTGSDQPYGVVSMASAGVTAGTGYTNKLKTDDLYDLKHSLDPAYQANAQWMFHNKTLAALKKLKAGNGEMLWQAGLAAGVPDRIDGDPYVINQDMPQLVANAKAILYGDFSKYKIRDVTGMAIKRLDERYADQGQVAFIAFMRTGGVLVDAGTHPIVTLTCAAS